jgi:3-oxoacyl-[acyl-carrier-protein] synthase III
MNELRFARIASTGSALASLVVPNSYFEGLVDTTDQWIRERTGIESRRFAAHGETTATLSADAAARALAAAGVPAESVDMLIVATCTPDRPLPAAAAFVQAQMGMRCPSFDLNAACAGFVYALSMGDAQVRCGAADRVLVVGADVLSRMLNMTDRTTCVLFGDGAGAALLEPGDEPGVLDSRLALDGRYGELLTIPAGGSEEPTTPQSLERGRTKIHMADGPAVFREAVTSMATACRELLDKAGVSPSDLDAVVAHQANARIVSAVGKRLGVDPAKITMDIAEVGNTSAASIPIALDRAWRSGRLSPGDLVLTTAFGAGFAWGANLFRWSAPVPDAKGEAWTDD